MKISNHIDLSKELFSRHQIKSLVDLGAGQNPQYQMRYELGISQLLIDLNYSESDEPMVCRRKTDVSNYYKLQKTVSDFCDSIEETGKKVDAVVSIQNIEHLEKSSGIELIQNLETIAKKLIIIETPNGFVAQSGTLENPFQEHLSGWSVGDFEKLGYKVLGTTGLKLLRRSSNKGSYKINVKGMAFLDRILSKIFNIKANPKLAFNLFAYKVLD